MTYSIVARDPATGQLGIGVQSHYFAAGAAVPWAEAGVGAVATQSVPDLGYGPKGLALMRSGVSAPDALARLVAEDEMAPLRQVAMVDATGALAVHTGAACVPAAQDATGEQVSVQANMMLRDTVVAAMLTTYASSEGSLARRMLAALEAAEAEGGDARGRQAAGMLVVSGEQSDAPWDHVLLNVRVDDSDDPLTELRRLIGMSEGAAAMSSTFPLLFAPELDESTSTALEAALETLDRVQTTYGTGNYEPTFWKSVLLAKAGRIDAARAALATCRAGRPEWAEFVRHLGGSGIPHDPAIIDALLADPG
jgi:uncharacterized Ntn-hydrolase superfamily protein